MPLTEGQKTAIQEASQEANIRANRIIYAIQRPMMAVQDYEQLDPAETHLDAIGIVNGSKAKAIIFCDELKAYLASLSDIT
jgi:hypothetical protein